MRSNILVSHIKIKFLNKRHLLFFGEFVKIYNPPHEVSLVKKIDENSDLKRSRDQFLRSILIFSLELRVPLPKI